MEQLFEVKSGEMIKGELRYIADEYSIDFEPEDRHLIVPANELTLSIGATLQLLVDLPSKRLLYVYGYCPVDSLEKSELNEPIFIEGKVYMNAGEGEYDAHMSHETGLDTVKGKYDTASGWMQFSIGEGDQNILIADGVGVTLQNGNLRGLWLKPRMS